MSNQVDLAAAWLIDLLQEHDMLEAMIKCLGKKHPSHFSLITLRRAKKKLGLISTPVGNEKASLTDMLAAVQARRIWDGAASISEEDVTELKAEISTKNGRIRWMWGIPSDERLKTSIDELDRQCAYYSAEVQRLSAIANQLRYKLGSRPVALPQDELGADVPAVSPAVPSRNKFF
jgi:hypothetical protein